MPRLNHLTNWIFSWREKYYMEQCTKCKMEVTVLGKANHWWQAMVNTELKSCGLFLICTGPVLLELAEKSVSTRMRSTISAPRSLTADSNSAGNLSSRSVTELLNRTRAARAAPRRYTTPSCSLPLSVPHILTDVPPFAGRNRCRSRSVQLDLCVQNDGYRTPHPSI